jgi:hypothetical protein
MSIWPVGDEPDVELTRWRVLEIPSIDGEGMDRHLNGSAAHAGDPGRVSSKIISFNSKTMVGTTRSGKKYRLKGIPGCSGDPLYVWDRWAAFNKVDPDKVIDVTGEYT